MARIAKSENAVEVCSLLLVGATLLAGCALANAPEQLRIEFDGERCAYFGPETVVEATWPISLVNQTDYDMHLAVGVLDPDKNWQDVLDLIGEPGSESYFPGWVDLASQGGIAADPAVRTYRMQAGTNIIICIRDDPRQVWPGAAIEVGPK